MSRDHSGPNDPCWLREDRKHLFQPYRGWFRRLRWECVTCGMVVTPKRRPSFKTRDGYVQFWVGQAPPPSVRKPR